MRVRPGAEAVKVLPEAVVLADGTSEPPDVTLWAGGVRTSPLAAEAGLAVDDRGRVVTDAALRSVSHPTVYAVGDAAAVRQGYGLLHGTCQSGMPTGVHAAGAILRELAGRPPAPFRFGYYHMPVSLGRHDAVVQFTRPDGSPRRWRLTGPAAAWYKETVSARRGRPSAGGGLRTPRGLRLQLRRDRRRGRADRAGGAPGRAPLDDEGRIATIHNLANPDKLNRLS